MRIDDSRPIWAQLVDEVRRLIASGEWPPGGKIPSVRELALEFGANPNTVQKALVEIDRLGLTTTERTVGRFVTTDHESVAAARSALAETSADHFIDAMSGIGLEPATAIALLEQRWAQRAAHGKDVP